MRTLQNYRDIFREISNNLGYRGDSVELLIQFLANATYISEVENISYMQEASLEKAVLLNSKIQHCMDMMYSVYRGSCPRIILNLRPTKYLNLSMYDELVISNNFKVYYIGYWSNSSASDPGKANPALLDGFIEGPVSLSPTTGKEVYPILGILAKETVDIDSVLTDTNPYYIELLENDLSNDLMVKVDGGYVSNTRQFSDHILDGSIFDLTLPSYGSRLYIPPYKWVTNESSSEKEWLPISGTTISSMVNTQISATYYKFSELSSYNMSEIKKIYVRGADIVSFDDYPKDSEGKPLEGYEKWRFYDDPSLVPGMTLIKESARDDMISIHYKANRDRYVNSIFRSNSDIGSILEEMYPDKIALGGIYSKFQSNLSLGTSNLLIYYIPDDRDNLLTKEELDKFYTKKSYYVTSNIEVLPGNAYQAIFNLDLELYNLENDQDTLDTSIKQILSGYSKRFGMDFSEEGELEGIKSLISKISNVKQILSISVDYLDLSGAYVDISQLEEPYYFDVTCNLNTVIQSKLSI